MIRPKYKTFGMCCGLGGGAKGLKYATSQVSNRGTARQRC